MLGSIYFKEFGILATVAWLSNVISQAFAFWRIFLATAVITAFQGIFAFNEI